MSSRGAKGCIIPLSHRLELSKKICAVVFIWFAHMIKCQQCIYLLKNISRACLLTGAIATKQHLQLSLYKGCYNMFKGSCSIRTGVSNSTVKRPKFERNAQNPYLVSSSHIFVQIRQKASYFWIFDHFESHSGQHRSC